MAKFHPIFGIRPGVYLSAGYGVLLLAFLFCLLVVPGIVRPGGVFVVTSSPEGAAVRLDGVYAGRTPARFFALRGEEGDTHTIEVVSPGFQPVTIREAVKNRLFCSIFAPAKTNVHAKLAAEEPLAPLIEGAREAASWVFAGEPVIAYQAPPALSEAAERFGLSGGFSGEARENAREVLRAASRFASTRFAASDLCRALFVTESGGRVPSPSNALSALGLALDGMRACPESALWLGTLLEGKAQTALLESEWHKNALARVFPETPSSLPPPALLQDKPVPVAGVEFVKFAGGPYMRQTPFPHTVEVAEFWAATDEVGTEAWARFAAEQPEYMIIEETSETFKEQPETGVSGVSWYAASAFCRWLSERLPPELAGWEARLPQESEWEYAETVVSAETAVSAGSARVKRMSAESGEAGLWEWCAEPFAPNDFLPAAKWAQEAVSSPERSVRGGSWVNSGGTVSRETRASLPPDTKSPFVGFRPVLVKKAPE